MTQTRTFLGIESSCDETAAAVVRQTKANQAEILSNIVATQAELHAAYGGVVPEIAARAHAEKLDFCVEQALHRANIPLGALDGIGVTAGPGLIGGVVAGVMCAKALSAATGKPLYGVNHLAGHALTPRLTNGVAFPFLMLLVSGGHCQFLLVHGPDSFKRLGGTIDDAPGEAFDKVARLIALGQPGGPAIEREAMSGDPRRFDFPRPLLDRPTCDMSFSGLKTAVRRQRDVLVTAQGGLRLQDQADLAASFQAAVADVLAVKARTAFAACEAVSAFCVAGGVAANAAIRARLESVSRSFDTAFIAPPLVLCTDNAAMIAYTALEQSRHRPPDDLTLSARPRWPLDATQPGLIGSGKKGAKA
ncbi:MAG: tRNA (adenosine(37)-N6)-threonylcarbamoyltransferase complex transferase subunit TsaD [Pseudomonadota bacterium]